MKKHYLIELQDIGQESSDLYIQHMRQISVLLNDYLLKYLNSLYAEFDGDLGKAIVLGELAHHNIAKMMKNGLFDPSYMDQAGELDNRTYALLSSNPYSISEATGIPRETVRRKFAELIKEGMILKVAPKSYVIAPQVSKRFINTFNLQLFEETSRLCTQLHAIIYGSKAKNTAEKNC